MRKMLVLELVFLVGMDISLNKLFIQSKIMKLKFGWKVVVVLVKV